MRFDDGGATWPGTLGSDFADIQADPLCGFWAVGTLGNDPGGETPPVESDQRSVWLTWINGCNSIAEMSGDGTVDGEDFLLFSKYHAAGDHLADMNRDGRVDAFDYARYLDEYAKRPK